MKPSRFTEERIIEILREQGALSASSGVRFRTLVHATTEHWWQPRLAPWEMPRRDPAESPPNADSLWAGLVRRASMSGRSFTLARARLEAQSLMKVGRVSVLRLGGGLRDCRNFLSAFQNLGGDFF